MYLASVQVVPVAVVDSIDSRGVNMSEQVVPVTVLGGIDYRGVCGVSTGSTSGCSVQY